MTQPNLRACDDAHDINHLIEQALEQVDRTYANLAQLVMAFTPDDNRLVGMVAQARSVNNVMLATLRHPSGGER